MPSEAQLLYFHMVLRADDDGVVESYPLMKLLGVAPDNFKVLLAKNFIKVLNEDQVIVITDWLEHNKIRVDRKVNSVYINLLKEKCPELPVIAPKPRSDVEDNSRRLGVDCPRTAEDKLSQAKISEDKLISSSKSFYKLTGEAMRYSQKKWWVLPKDGGQWLEFAGQPEDIEWR